MLFNSVAFLVFFPIVTTLYFLVKAPADKKLGHRWIVLLVASCFFYMWFIPKYILVLFFLIMIDYFAAIKIENAQTKNKKRFLLLSIFSTLSILFIFKYYNFFNSNLALLAEKLGYNYSISSLNILLPLGLSFHTFQSLSYVVEVYRGNQKAERHLGIFALYVMFYPQLCAGPIERPQHLLHQFRERFYFNYKQVTFGLKRMGWGLFKKVIIADRLGVVVTHIYGSPLEQQGPSLVIATLFFAFQMYSDFSGYTDIAIGSAEVMGFKLRSNFIRPYFSKSIQEYWRRWHISLSSWFKDYVYIPLGGKRCSPPRWYFNLLITFLCSGLWHGANWTYITWGLINGFYLLFSLWTKDLRDKYLELPLGSFSPFLLKLYQVFITFLLVCIGRIFTRSETIHDAWYILTHLGSGWGSLGNKFLSGELFNNHFFVSLFGEEKASMAISIGLIGLLIAVDLIQRKGSVREQLARMPVVFRWGLYFILSYSVLWNLLLRQAPNNEFIYFQF